MAVRIKFDAAHNAEQPTFVLSTRKGKLIGKIPITNLQFKDALNSASTARFDVNKADTLNNLWEQIKDFKLVWAREWNAWFELKVDTTDKESIYKSVTATSLGEAELSQINLYNYQINTESDIEREDYVPTVLYKEDDPKASLLHRILAKAPHYHIAHVDASIANIQRTFSFDGKTIYDAFREISEEINCLIQIKCYSDEHGNIVREIRVYDLESYCVDCGHRGDFTDHCDECGSSNILHGYGEDTTIFVSSENLANEITFTTDTGSVKNCFKLEAGDDLMTATIANCNSNGTAYIWYISDETKSDMSSALVSKLNDYDADYDYYQNEYTVTINSELRNRYNQLIDKYSVYSDSYSHIPASIVGYPSLMKEYYNAIDFYLFLNDTLMPGIVIPETTAVLESAKLNTTSLSPVAVQNLNTVSVSTATNAVLQMAKTIVDSRYQVKITESYLDETTWSGKFTVVNYSDEEDACDTNLVNVTISDNYESFVKQKIDKILSKQNVKNADIISLFKLDSSNFAAELKKYCLSMLNIFHECCQSCIDILIEQGIADDKTWANQTPNLYSSLYTPYYQKLGLIASEIGLRENEIAVLTGTYDRYGDLTVDGIQTIILAEQENIQKNLDFEDYLGEELWLEFATYRREDTYSNTNYVSDGLDNAELFDNALDFIEIAKKDIYKSATLQHSITSNLKNLLVMKEFSPLVDKFAVGNWLRIKIDTRIYLLRLIEYSIDFENLSNLSVTFSDVKIIKNGLSDVASIQAQAKSMATSYASISRQASKGKKSNDQLNDWVNKGFALTKMKIIDNSDNQNITWDSHGILCTEYLPITDSYDDKQLKIINKGLYVTDDNWKTSRAGIGNFIYYDPDAENDGANAGIKESYGVIADAIINNIMLSRNVGIYNEDASIVLNKDGMTFDGGLFDRTEALNIDVVESYYTTPSVDGCVSYWSNISLGTTIYHPRADSLTNLFTNVQDNNYKAYVLIEGDENYYPLTLFVDETNYVSWLYFNYDTSTTMGERFVDSTKPAFAIRSVVRNGAGIYNTEIRSTCEPEKIYHLVFDSPKGTIIHIDNEGIKVTEKGDISTKSSGTDIISYFRNLFIKIKKLFSFDQDGLFNKVGYKIINAITGDKAVVSSDTIAFQDGSDEENISYFGLYGAKVPRINSNAIYVTEITSPSIQYLPGDTYSINWVDIRSSTSSTSDIYPPISGHLTNTRASVHLLVNVEKSLEKCTSVSVTKCVGALRGIAGYMYKSGTTVCDGSTDWLDSTLTNISIYARIINNNTVGILINNSSQFYTAAMNNISQTNNSPATFACKEFELTFS